MSQPCAPECTGTLLPLKMEHQIEDLIIQGDFLSAPNPRAEIRYCSRHNGPVSLAPIAKLLTNVKFTCGHTLNKDKIRNMKNSRHRGTALSNSAP